MALNLTENFIENSTSLKPKNIKLAGKVSTDGNLLECDTSQI